MPKKYKIIGPNAGNYPVGTICYEYLQHDYGVAGDDSRLLGETFVSVTLNTNGGPPSFTIRERHLEEIVELPRDERSILEWLEKGGGVGQYGECSGVALDRLIVKKLVVVGNEESGVTNNFIAKGTALEYRTVSITALGMSMLRPPMPAAPVDPVAALPLERVKLYAELLPKVRAILERHGCPADTIDDVAIGVAREMSIDAQISEWFLAELQRIHRPN